MAGLLNPRRAPVRGDALTDPVHRFSGIGRSVDPHYPTNRAILVLLPVAFAAGAVWTRLAGAGWPDAGFLGVNAALTVFLAWALTRDITPDDQAGAFVAVGLAGSVWAVAGPQSLMIPVVVLIAVRLVNRSTGKAAMLSDTLLVVGLFAFGSWTESWTLGIVGAAALALDGALPLIAAQPRRRRHLWLSLLLLALVAVRVAEGTAGLRLPVWWSALMVVAVLALCAGFLYPTPRSRGDVDGEPLAGARVRAAVLLAVGATVLVTLDGGVPTRRVGVLWSSLAAAIVGLPLLLVLARRAGSMSSPPSASSG